MLWKESAFHMLSVGQLWKESSFHIGQHTSQFICGGIGFYAVSSPGDDLDVGGCIAFGIVDTVQGG